MDRSTIAMTTLACGFTLAGCGSPTGIDFSPEAYDPIPQLHALDWSAVQPAQAWDYWELRYVGPGAPEGDSIVAAGGALEREALPPATLEAMDAARPPAGFSGGCLPAYCYKYVVAVEGDAVTVVASTDALRGFLAPVGSPEEAILLVAARSMVWWDAGQATGVRAVDGGWDVVVLELVRDCAPIQVDRVRFRVDATGAVRERAREVWERTDGACI